MYLCITKFCREADAKSLVPHDYNDFRKEEESDASTKTTEVSSWNEDDEATDKGY